MLAPLLRPLLAMEGKQRILMVVVGFLLNGQYLPGNCDTCKYNKLKCFKKFVINFCVVYGLNLWSTQSLSSLIVLWKKIILLNEVLSDI